ncbi:MAG: Ig-like domain-containing protein [Nanoarchaeota archaeon]|nr:Ig-like domain-containing protein [Nanoarchaeota archaeon]
MRFKAFNLSYSIFLVFGIILCISLASSTVDSIPPETAIISPSNSVYLTGEVAIEFATNEISRCTYSFDDLNWEPLSTADGLTHKDTAYLLNGEYTIIASCIDNADNENYGLRASFTVNAPNNEVENPGENTEDKKDDSKAGENTQIGENEIALTVCGELNRENTIYYLYNNIATSGTCFVITANNITIQGDGYGLAGDGETGDYGVLINGANQTSIIRLSINRFDAGIKAVGTRNSFIDDNVVVNSQYGIMVSGGSHNRLTRNYAYSNMNVGMYIDSSSDNEILYNAFDTNDVGLDLISSHNNKVMYTDTSRNDRGILLISSNNNEINHNSAYANLFGIALEIGSANNRLYNNTLRDNGYEQMGAGLAIAGNNNIIEKVIIDGSIYDGLYLFEESSTGNIFKNLLITNTLAGNGYDIRFADGSDHFGPAGINDTEFIDSSWDNYYITPVGGRIYIENSSVGSINFTEPVSGSGRLSEEIKFNPASIFIGQALNSKADLVFYGLPIRERYQIIRNEQACSSADCLMSIISPGKLKVRVPGSGIYSVNLSYNGEDNSGGNNENIPPTVNLDRPIDGQIFIATSASVVIRAVANDTHGISQVEFYEGSNLLNTDAIFPYEYTWEGVAVGNYSLTAKAYDSLGLSTTSSVVNIQVNAPFENSPPSVILDDPIDGESFIIGGPAVPLNARATDAEGIQKVEFYHGATLILSDNQAPYGGNWVPTDAGTYIITVKAYDNLGASATSQPVTVILATSNSGGDGNNGNTTPQDIESPQITVSLPVKDRVYQFNETGELNFFVQTNEPAYCNYTLDSGRTNQTMNRDSGRNSFTASYLFEAKNRTLVTYHFMAQCRDNTGNTNSSDIRFFANFTMRINSGGDSGNTSTNTNNTNTGNNNSNGNNSTGNNNTGNNNQNNNSTDNNNAGNNVSNPGNDSHNNEGNQNNEGPLLTYPNITLHSPQSLVYNTTGVWIYLSLDRAGECGYSLDNGATNITLPTLDQFFFSEVHSGLSNNVYFLQIYCTDLSGNRGNKSLSFMIDADSPIIITNINSQDSRTSGFEGRVESDYLSSNKMNAEQELILADEMGEIDESIQVTEEIDSTSYLTKTSLKIETNEDLKSNTGNAISLTEENKSNLFLIIGFLAFFWLLIGLAWLIMG